MPSLLANAGLRNVTVLYAGDTALAKATTHRVYGDLIRVGLAAAAVNLVLLALFLRSLIAPFCSSPVARSQSPPPSGSRRTCSAISSTRLT